MFKIDFKYGKLWKIFKSAYLNSSLIKTLNSNFVIKKLRNIFLFNFTKYLIVFVRKMINFLGHLLLIYLLQHLHLQLQFFYLLLHFLNILRQLIIFTFKFLRSFFQTWEKTSNKYKNRKGLIHTFWTCFIPPHCLIVLVDRRFNMIKIFY